MRCPTCGSNESLWVNALVTVDLSFDETGEVDGSEPTNSDHEWDDDSVGGCWECLWVGYVRDMNSGPTEDPTP